MLKPFAGSNMAWQDMFPVVETSNLVNEDDELFCSKTDTKVKFFCSKLIQKHLLRKVLQIVLRLWKPCLYSLQSEDLSSASFGSRNLLTDPLELTLKENTGIMEESEFSAMMDVNVSSLEPNLESLDFNFLWQSGLTLQNNLEIQSDVLPPSTLIQDRDSYTDLLALNKISTCGSSTVEEPPMFTELISARNDLIEFISEDSNISTISVNSNSCENKNKNARKISPKLAQQKYLEMRRKNNIASRRSRKTRKMKDVEMAVKLKELETENKKLTLLAEKLEKQSKILQKYLLKAISKG